MKSAAAFATFLALSLFVATDGVHAAPALRGLRPNADTQATEDDESRKDHHHHHVKVVKKVKKIAIPVPVEVPQFIPVPVSVPSTVVASSNNAVVSSNNNVVAAPGPGAVGPGAPGAPGAPGPGAPGPATSAPTTLGGRPAPTPAATSTGRSRPTPAPTGLANGGTSGAQLPAPQGGGAGMAGVPPSPGFGGSGNAFGAGFGAPGAGSGTPPNGGAFGGGFAGNPMRGFGGANRMGALGGVGGPGAGMGGGLAGNIGGFGQQMGPGMQGGNTFGGFGGQGAMGNFGQTGNNGFAGAAGGQLGCGDYVQELRTLIAGTAADPLPEAVTLTVFMEGLRTSAARTEVFCVHPSSFEEAVRVALKAEHHFRSARPGWYAGSAGSSSGPEPMDLSYAEGEEAELLTEEQRASIRRCFTCGSTRHLRASCPVRNQRKAPPSQASGSLRGNGKELSSVGPPGGRGQQDPAPKRAGLSYEKSVCKPALLVVQANVKGFEKPWRVLIASGASGNYAGHSTLEGSQQYAETLEVQTRDTISVRLATRTLVTVSKVTVDLGVKFLTRLR